MGELPSWHAVDPTTWMRAYEQRDRALSQAICACCGERYLRCDCIIHSEDGHAWTCEWPHQRQGDEWGLPWW